MSLAPGRMVGREAELRKLSERLEAARVGNGSTVIICGETGIGKTRLLDELASSAVGVRMLRGSCLLESASPFLPFREALASGGLGALLAGGQSPRLEAVYLISLQGLLLGKAERRSTDFDADVFSSMLHAVESFVQDSLSRFSGRETQDGLNSMGYGRYTILLQKCRLFSMVAMISGQRNEFLIEDLGAASGTILRDFGSKIEYWNGIVDRVKGIEGPLEALLSSGKYDGIDYARDDPRLRQANIMENVARGLERESRAFPVCLVLEDLQWSDPSSLALLHFLSRNTRRDPVLLIGTYRPEDLLPSPDGSEHPLLAFLRTAASENLLERTELGRLGPEHTDEMVRDVLGPSELPPEFTAQVHRETDGNPMFVLELLRLYEQEGAVFREGGAWRAREACTTCAPARVNEVVLRRLGRLSQEQRDVLDCASVIGLEFSADLLGRALDLNRLRLLRTLKELEDPHRLVRARQDRYRFDQTRVRELLYSGLGPDLRREYHRLVAAAMEGAAPEGPAAEELAYHYMKGGEPAKAVPLLAAAGDRARREYANPEALRYYTDALDLMGADPQYAGDIAGLQDRSGEVLSATGDFDRAVERYRKALAVLTSGRLGWGPPARLRAAAVMRRMSESLEKKGDLESAEHGLESALQMLGEDDPAERGRALLGKGVLRWKQGDYAGADAFIRESLGALGTAGADRKDLSKAHNLAGLVAQSRGDYDGALLEFQTSLDIDLSTGDLRSAISTRNNIGVALWNKDDYDRALRIFEENLASIEKVGDRHALGNTLNNLGLIQWNRGRYAQAREWHLKSLAVRERIGDRPGIASCLNNLGLVDWGLGEHASALQSFGRCLALREELGDRSGTAVVLNNIGNVLADRSRYGEALDHYRRSLAISEELGDRQGIAIALNNLGDVSSRLGRMDEAFGHHQRSVGILESIGDIQGVAVAYNNIGNLYIEKGEYDRTLEYFEKSRAIIERIGDERGLAVALNNLGDLHYYKGEPARAEELYLQSVAIAERTGDRRILVENFCGLAEARLRQGDLEGAASHASTANEMSRAVGLRENEGWSLRILGRVYGKQGKWMKCMELLDQGVRLYREIGLEAEEGDALLEIGEAYLERGELEKAGDCLEKAADIFERRGMAAKAERARVSLEKMGSPGAAADNH
ncbi:MAG: tetratricopeptide repeat protein [Euryarchaeota archaeon]|nr:tetratricopeptide repeat protein [Euryarchaeota archaeon]